ncbi:MAG: hypothetical protein OJF49_004749 [Ktedonobacterales bacterium]|nr:MAG: hypothetical protein OJF49_004749 [Ktedonobacterales bacterium]
MDISRVPSGVRTATPNGDALRFAPPFYHRHAITRYASATYCCVTPRMMVNLTVA